MGFVLIFLTAVLASLILERQERQHSIELNYAYKRIDRELPRRKPKLPLLESWLNIAVGVYIFIIGVFVAIIMIHMFSLNGANIEPEHSSILRQNIYFSAVFIATGFALIFLGIKSVKKNKEFARG